MEVRKLRWISDNGKYKVLVRHFDEDPGPLVGVWAHKSNGKFGPVKYRDLPGFVLEKIEEMKSQVMFKA